MLSGLFDSTPAPSSPFPGAVQIVVIAIQIANIPHSNGCAEPHPGN